MPAWRCAGFGEDRPLLGRRRGTAGHSACFPSLDGGRLIVSAPPMKAADAARLAPRRSLCARVPDAGLLIVMLALGLVLRIRETFYHIHFNKRSPSQDGVAPFMPRDMSRCVRLC
jgi:hypothetical protein